METFVIINDRYSQQADGELTLEELRKYCADMDWECDLERTLLRHGQEVVAFIIDERGDIVAMEKQAYDKEQEENNE